MHNLCHRSRIRPWHGQHNSTWGKFPHLWHRSPPKFIMDYQCKQFKPSPLLNLLLLDKYLHNKIVPTNLPSIINKGKLEIISPGTKPITNHREVVNNQTLPTMPQQTESPKTPHDKMHQDAIPDCAQTNPTHSATFMGTTHLSVPLWVELSKPFKTRPNRLPTLQIKPNPS